MTEKRIASAAVREMCGGVSDVTVRRWMKSRGFPEPQHIHGRRYWREADVLAWLDAQAANAAA
jgi:predicted DNA-binding transcriptional regulator AlpA